MAGDDAVPAERGARRRVVRTGRVNRIDSAAVILVFIRPW